MFCTNCGKEIPNESKFCPECGAELRVAEVNETNTSNIVIKEASYNTLCIVGIVISGISMWLNFFGIVGLAGTIVSYLGLKECKKKNENGYALAMIGVCIGGPSFLYGVSSLLSLMYYY